MALLPRVVFSINNSETAATGFSPFYVERGRDPLIPFDRDATMSRRPPERQDTREFVDHIWNIEKQVEERRAKVRAFYEQTMDQRMRQAKDIKVGGRVWLSANGITMPWDRNRTSKKLSAKYYGPFEVLEQTSPVTFKLRLPATVHIHPIFHVGLLKAAYDDEPSRKPLPTSNDDGEYEVEKIVSHKKRKDGKKVYLVKWKGYSYEECTWEPAKHFKPTTLNAYHRARKEAKANETDSSSEDDDEHVLAAVGTAPIPRGSDRPNEQIEVLNLADSAPHGQTGGSRLRGQSSHPEPSTMGPVDTNHTVCMATVDDSII